MAELQASARPELIYRRYWLAIGIGMIGVVICLSLVPMSGESGIEEGDKVGHVLAYGVLMMWFAQLENGLTARIWLAVGFSALGIGLEFVQRATGYRTFDSGDIVAGLAGVAIGWLASPPRTCNLLQFTEALIGRAD
jgi:hypothetical protein